MKIEPPPAVPSHAIMVEKDVDIPMRDGARLKADVFRPDAKGGFPAIMNLGPYQKDKLWVPPDTLAEKPNPLMNWETVNPEWWVPQGYAAVRVDMRGSGKSPGQWSLGRWRRRSISMTRSNGRRRSPGATARSGCPASPISPSISGSRPICSRPH